jgi:hypothetical protein
MSAAGADTSDNSHTTATFLAALVTAGITMTVYTALFIVLRGKFQRVYQPRTLLAPER